MSGGTNNKASMEVNSLDVLPTAIARLTRQEDAILESCKEMVDKSDWLVTIFISKSNSAAKCNNNYKNQIIIVVPVESTGSSFRPPGACPCNILRNSSKTRRHKLGVVCHTSDKMAKTPCMPKLTI